MNKDPLLGRQLANFLIERVLGRGGMAQVYYGQDVKLQRPVAIKVIDARYRGKPAYAQRFVKEARAVARWRHENIIQIYYADDQDGLYYYAMEYIDGQDLASILAAYAAQGELMPAEDVLRIGRAIASALDYAHKHGVIHRDVKPSNIMVADDGRIVLGDFGLALDMQEGSSGEAFGTPHYISPEQARRSSEVVPQSDLYSLGVILFEMLTGVVPFDDPSPTSVALQHITQPPPAPRSLNPQLSEAVEAVLLKAIAKIPQERYQNGGALLAALAEALAQTNLSDANQPKILPLPAIPAGVLSGQTATVARRQNAPAAAPTAAQLPAESASRPRRGKGLLAATLLFLLLSLIAIFWFFPELLPFSIPPSPPPVATSTPAPTHPPAADLPAAAPASATPATDLPAAALASATSAIDLPAAATASATSEPLPPTETETPAPSATLSPSPTESATVTETASPTATVGAAIPALNGKKLLFYYDESGFYVLNTSNASRSISPLIFERLDPNDQPLNRFEGWLWAEFYATLHPERCMRIEITKSEVYLRPPLCESRTLSSRFYARESEYIFWTAQPESQQFRVLWQGEEVGRCQIGAGSCEVFIP